MTSFTSCGREDATLSPLTIEERLFCHKSEFLTLRSPSTLKRSAKLRAGFKSEGAEISENTIYFHGKPLPGCEPGYFKGKAPDAGAIEIE